MIEAETRTFLATLFELTEQDIELRSCSNDAGGQARSIFSRDGEKIGAFVKQFDIDGRGVYVGGSTRRLGRESGARKDCVETPAVWLDIDCRKMGMLPASALGPLGSAAIPPSIVVDSGNGIHAYWLLNEPAIVDQDSDEGRENEGRVIAVMRQLAGVFAGDIKVCEVARIMRLPGSHNSKEMAKAANGGAPILCKTIWCEPRRYDLHELEDWLEIQRPLIDMPAAFREAGAGGADLPPDDPYLRYAKESGARVPLDAAKELARMVYGGAAGVHDTQLRVSGHMVQRGYDDEAIVDALMRATIRAAGFQGGRWNWRREEQKIRRMIAGARAKHYDDKAKSTLETPPPLADGEDDEARGEAAEVREDSDPPPVAEPISLAARRARGKAQAAPAAAPAAKPDAEEAPASDIEEVARAVLAFWRGERGELRVQHGEFWLCRDAWARFDTILNCTLGVDISEMTTTLRKKTTSTFLNNVRRRLLEMAGLQMPSDFPGWDRLGWIVCQDSSINVLTGQIAQHNPYHYATIKIPCRLEGWERDEQPKVWLGLLEEAFSDRSATEREAIIGVIQEWIGAALIRGKPKGMSRALILHGESGTGKTRIANVVTALMGGKERVARLAVAQLDRPFGLEALLGKTAWIRDDGIAAGDDLACEAFKNLVTGDAISISRKNKTDVEWQGEIPIMLTANNLPRINDPTDAVYDRLILIEMRVKRGGKDGEIASTQLDELLRGEIAGILLWAVKGLKRLAARGEYRLPEAMKRSARELREMNNPIQTWIDECCVADEGARVHRVDMLVSLNSWFNDAFGGTGRRLFGAKTMNVHLRTKMPGANVDQKSNGQVYVSGLALNAAGLAAWERGALDGDRGLRPHSNTVDSVNRTAPTKFA